MCLCIPLSVISTLWKSIALSVYLYAHTKASDTYQHWTSQYKPCIHVKMQAMKCMLSMDWETDLNIQFPITYNLYLQWDMDHKLTILSAV